MEVIPINTNENVASKTALWADRIHAFQGSGLSRKDWCQQNGIPQSTLSYWIRKIQSEDVETEGVSGLVFARLPMEQELDVPIHTGTPPVTILLPENIRMFGASSEKYADRYLQPLYSLMKEELLRSGYLHGDETRIQVIDEPDQKGSTQNWMWVYLTDEYSGSPRMVLFQYERTRGGYHPVKFLGNQFGGYFTCDGYQAYHSLPERITVTGCMPMRDADSMKL